jgi:tetratricopeptide (TPR) repeat protein
VQREGGNLRQAWARAGQFALWPELFLAMRAYWSLYDLQGLLHEGSAATEPLIHHLAEQATTPERQRTLGRLLCYCGYFYFRQGDNERAHSQMERSLRLLRSLNDPGLLIDPLIFHGVVAYVMGQPGQAAAELTEGLALAQAAQADWFTALALLNRGYLASYAGATPAIYAEMQEALAIWRRLGGLRTTALALNYLSPVAIQLGHLTEAQHFLEECLALAQQLGDRWLIGTAHSHQALLAHARGDLAQAEATYHQAIALFQELQLLRDLCMAQVFLGEVQMERGKPAVAHQTLVAGTRLALRVGSVPTVLAALLDFAMLPQFGSLAQRLLLVAFVRQHAVKTQRLARDTERLWAELSAQLSPIQLEATQTQAQSMTLEEIVTVGISLMGK